MVCRRYFIFFNYQNINFTNCEEVFMEVHENIKFLRQFKSWSQEQMAEKLDMSLNGYAKIEQG
jgi:ribosome-binding protein aMBF1 (putative translation factor)